MARSRSPRTARGRQRGVATLIVALCLLVILTIILLASSNVALFEQKTANNENREMLAQQAAEYGLTLGGEFLKANVADVASTEANGWLESGGSTVHWVSCSGISAAGHPCMAAPQSIRNQMYYFTTDGNAATNAGNVRLNLLTTLNAAQVSGTNVVPTATRLSTMGGTTGTAFTVSGTTVSALLCRLDTTPGSTPTCQASPQTGNRIAITMIATSSVTGENSAAVMKETWGTYSSFSAQAALPLVASGLVQGLGNASIVTAPNAGGYGIAGSIWSPNDVSIDGSGANGVGSVSTCNLGGYLGSVPISQLETTCAGNGNTGCGCSNVDASSPDALSGHLQGNTVQEMSDILDVDSNHGNGSIGVPDIQFFPGRTSGGTWMDTSAATDDNLFEWIFNTDVTGAADGTDNHGAVNYGAEVSYLVNDLGATTAANCSGLDSSSSGLYYISGSCDLPTTVGSPDNPVVVVASGDVTLGSNTTLFGMLFVRDAGAGASFTGHGNATVFGSVVAEGQVNITGGLTIVYVENTAGSPGKKLPKTTRFARLPGSWLDSASGF